MNIFSLSDENVFRSIIICRTSVVILILFLRAVFNGTRIILRQNSGEVEPIFDLILQLHWFCDGDWPSLGLLTELAKTEIDSLLIYFSIFLTNFGNYTVCCIG